MNRNPAAKQCWEMTTEELRDATREFDEEFVAEKAKPLTPEMRARWERAKRKSPRAGNGAPQETIAVRMEKALLDRFTALAKPKRTSLDALIPLRLKALLP